MFAFGSGGENYRTSMDTIERIEELKREIVKQKLLIESEEAKIEKVKRCCGVVAELLCAQCRELAEEVVWDILGHMIECSQKKISGNEKAGLKEAVKTLLEHEMKNLESLSADEEMWPHIDCRIQVNLDERLKKAQFVS